MHDASKSTGAQDRGDADAYTRYLAGMDASMKQKVALTAAHLLCEGAVADMGMGSGTGSEALAALYPRLRVVGVDMNPEMVARARERYRRSNLEFLAGDIAQAVFPADSLDGIFDSSVLHHVTTFGGYRYENAAKAIEVQVAALKPHGVLIVRDFLDPGPGDVLLDLPVRDGDETDDPRSCSTVRLFERFAREFRSLCAEPGFRFERREGAPEGWQRYALTAKLAAEFVLRKDYRTDWESEVKEEYTYFSQAEFESLFARLGLRLLASQPLRNPWIIRHRFEGKLELRSPAGEELEPPPTNYLIAGERVPESEGVRFREGAPRPLLGFLELSHFRKKGTGELRDLVRRPHATIDVLPFFRAGGALYVMARMSYPRPILSFAAPRLDGATPAAWCTEPLNVLQQDKPLGQTVEEALQERAGISPGEVLRLEEGAHYYPSPGGVQEEVRSALVEVEPTFVRQPNANLTGLSSAGRVRAIDAQQLLRACQVGGLTDGRLELNTYEALLRQGLEVGPWIGEEISLADGSGEGAGELTELARRRAFERATESAEFLEVRCARFEELDARGGVIAQKALEYVVPKRLSINTVACAVLRRERGEVLLGLDEDDLPAAQSFSGGSELYVAPAWRLPREVFSLRAMRAFVAERLRVEHGLSVGAIWELGGRYYPSAGVTPEVVFPLAIEAVAETAASRRLHWVPLAEAMARRALLFDGHLRILLMRAAHATGQLSPRSAARSNPRPLPGLESSSRGPE